MEIDEKLLPQYNSAVRDELQNYLNELAPISPLAGGSSGRGAGSDPETYLKPVETRDDFIASGLINEDGSPTDSGKRFDDLGMAGVIDANGLLTDKGRAYKLSDDELVREENIDAYKIADSDGLFKKKDQPLSTYVSNALGGVYDAVKGAFELIPTVSPVYNAYVMATGSEEEIEKKLNEDKVKIDSFVQDATKSVMNSSLLALKAAGVLSKESDKYINVLDKYIPDSFKTPEMVELANQRNKELDERYWKTKQRNQALTNIVEGYNNSKLVNDLGITTDLVLRAEEAKAALPPERVQEIQKNVGSFASLVIDPLDIIPFGKAFGAGRAVETAYSGQRAAGKLAEEMARKSNAELAIANYEPIALASQDAADLAFRKADGFSSVGNIERADTIRAFGEKMRGRAESLKPLLDQAAIDIQKSTRNIDRLSQFTDAPAILETMADAGRKSASVIADRVGRATNAIGAGLEKIDSGISGFISDTGVDQARKALNVISLVKTGALFSGVPALQVAAGVISSGPILKAVGNFSRVMGQEALEKIGSVPFWQRVAANETIGPMGKALSHFFDSATTAGMFGGRAATDAIKGTAQLVPIMTAIGVAENDGELDANVLKGAIGQSVAFGGVGRAMGGMMIGSKRDIRVNQLGDELNFRKRIEDPEQLSRFINLPAGIRRSIGTYSAAFPELKWDFRTEGGSYYTDNGVSSSVAININSTNPLKALVAHEVNHALLIKNGMEEAVASLLVGDGIQNGGIIRALDGTLDPSFEKFKTEYHARMERQARSNNQIYNPIDDRKMAVEYFVDSKADRMLEMAQSGQLGRIAGKSKMNAVLDSVISSIPIIKDMHMKMGGTYEANGKMVDGTGLATLIETPQGKKLFNDMLHDSAGWRRSNKLSKYNSEPSSTIFLDENDPMHKLLVSDYETDVNGVMILDKNKKPIPISRDTDQRREAGGFKIDEIQRNRVAAGETLADGELRYNPSTKSWDGYFLSNAAIAQLEATNVFNRKQIEMLRSLNRTAQKGDGSRFQVLYNPATSRGRGGKVRYATRGIKLAEVVPVGVKVGAKGQILIEVMDTHQLAENVKQMASKSKAQNLNHTIQTIMNDAQAIMDAHGKNKPSDPYFKDKYGEKWEDYKGFANAVFGKLSSAQAEKNPTLNKVKPSRPVFRTYRLDRTNKVTSMSGDQMPFNYNKIVANYLPEGNPLLDKNGEVINIRDEQQKAMDNAGKEQVRYMPEPIPRNYQSSRDETYLRSSIGPDGILDLPRPIKSGEALPTISMRHEYPVEDFKVFKFDKRASVAYAKNKNGVEISFKFDPKLMNQPEFADFDTKYDGMVVQLAMADRHGATDGDMGGHSFPDLKVNQENIVDDGNGNKYKLVWSNNAWGPVANMSSKAQKYGAFTLLTYNMDKYAHDSNTRTVRIFSNEIANSGLSTKDQNTILIVQNVALKKSLTSANKSDLRQLIKSQKDLRKKLDIDDKILAGSKRYSGVEKLSQTDRDSLIDSINNGEEMIKEEEKFLAESLGAKDASAEELKIDKLFREYQTKRRAYDKTPNSEKKKEAMLNAEKAIRTFQKTKEFKVAEGLLPSRELDTFSSTFKGRKALIKAVKAGDSSAKWGSFDAEAISQKIGDQLTGDNMHIVGSVELSRDPNFKAVYLGEDPKEIARMSEAEKAAAIKFKSNPDFVAHEAYLWSMLGPAESKHYFNTNQRSVLDSFPDFVTEYSELPVKEGKKKLNDPESKASEFNIVNTIRDQSKIPIVFKKESTTKK